MEEQIQSSFDKLTGKILGWLDAFIFNLPNIIIAFGVFSLTYWASGKLEKLFQHYLLKMVKHAAIRTLLARIISTFIVLMGIILALYILNLETTIKSLLAGAGLAGLAISFALQGTLSNTLSGLLIATNSDIEIGDWVEINGMSGEVVAIELRNTKLRLADNCIVFIPNKLILDTAVKNYSKVEGQWVNILGGVGNQNDLNEVKNAVLASFDDVPFDIDTSTITFQYTGFSEDVVNFEIHFLVNGINYGQAKEVKSWVIQQIQETLLQRAIVIVLPLGN